jgi:hypothetical protein
LLCSPLATKRPMIGAPPGRFDHVVGDAAILTALGESVVLVLLMFAAHAEIAQGRLGLLDMTGKSGSGWRVRHTCRLPRQSLSWPFSTRLIW